MAEFPAPADPAIGVPTKPWADAGADSPTITVSARASLLEALNMKNSFFFGVHETCQAKSRAGVRVVSACTLGLWAFAAGLLIGVFLFS
jgi:hypothetical protein